MPFPFAAAIMAAGQLYGGMKGSRAQSDAQRRQALLMRRALEMAQRNYDSRNPFRQAAYSALAGEGQRDWSGLYNPDLYRSEEVPYEESVRRTGARANANEAYRKTQNIDRTGNIKAALADFDKQSAPVFDMQSRRIGQRASQFGALGKGTINTELGELGARIARDRNSLQGDLIRDSEERSIDDAFRSLSAARDEERIGREDDESAYGRRVMERDRRTTLGRQGMLDQLTLGEANRAERQASLARALGLGGLGFGGDPSGLFMGASGQYGDMAGQAGAGAGMNWSALAQILAQYFGRNGSGGAGGYGSGNDYDYYAGQV